MAITVVAAAIAGISQAVNEAAFDDTDSRILLNAVSSLYSSQMIPLD
jgi:hypothetical protein